MTEVNKQRYNRLIEQTTHDLSKASPVEAIANLLGIGASVRLDLMMGRFNSYVGLTETEAEAVRTQLGDAIDLVYRFFI